MTHPLARIIVALDAGDDTRREAADIRRRHEGRVVTHVLARGAIEAYFSRRAIVEWLVSKEIAERDADSMCSWFDGRERLFDCDDRRWKEACGRFLGRGYRKLEDGPRIAQGMARDEIAPEIVDLLQEVFANAT